MNHFAIEAARCYSCRHGYGGGIWEYQAVRWLWHLIGWWSIFVAVIVVGGIAMIKQWLGIEDD